MRDIGPRTTTTTMGLASIGPGGDVLVLPARDAAKALGISERSLWAVTVPRGPLKAVRILGRVMYSRQSLAEYIAALEANPPPPATRPRAIAAAST